MIILETGPPENVSAPADEAAHDAKILFAARRVNGPAVPIRISPRTSRVDCGILVPMPTLPAVSAVRLLTPPGQSDTSVLGPPNTNISPGANGAPESGTPTYFQRLPG